MYHICKNGPYTCIAPKVSKMCYFPVDLLYSYGSMRDSVVPKVDDGYVFLNLSRAFPLFGQNYSTLYLSTNGFLSVNQPFRLLTPKKLPLLNQVTFIAPFWSDINTAEGGEIFYSESTDQDLLDLATSDIRTYFHNHNFLAKWIFVVTWDSVAYFQTTTTAVDTFQVALITDGSLTFVLFNYKELQWPTEHVVGRSALVGFNSGNKTGYYMVPESLTTNISNLAFGSNCHFQGRWAFKVDKLHPEDPDGIVGKEWLVQRQFFACGSFLFSFSFLLEKSDTPTGKRTSWTNSLLYPYGPALDTTSQLSDDGSSPQIILSTQIPLFGNLYSYLYVDNNGLLSFSQPVNTFTPSDIPLLSGNPFLAPFWADVNNAISGDIYYRQSTDPNLLSRVTSDIRSYFNYLDFTSRWLFVATWDRVAYYGSLVNQQQTNTFQVVLTTNGNATFVLFNYGTIQWTTGTASGGVNGTGGIPALAGAGVDNGNQTGFYKIPGSLTPAIINISSTSNVNVPGRWALEVNKLNPETPNKGMVFVGVRLLLVRGVGCSAIFNWNVLWKTYQTDLLYPYGPMLDTANPKSDDGSSPKIQLSTQTPLFGSSYRYLYVVLLGSNLFTVTRTAFWSSHDIPLPSGSPIIAPFWADVDNEITGDIYYRQSSDLNLIARATSDIRSYFNYPTFTSQWVFVATWDRVGYYGSKSNKTNTFQVVLTTDGNATFVLFNYGTIQWTTGTASGGVSGIGGTPALAGVDSGDQSGFYKIPGSLTPDILNLSSSTNVYFMGRWVFKVDKRYPDFPDTGWSSYLYQVYLRFIKYDNMLHYMM
ncbi:hypothetical protein AB205_0044100 [Pelobates cultripes]|uniref:NIDO domain-containing protein n=1 Tax=Pelobates cultripes TaxID=61616 RepID=A0AAD1T816_PELCU|nr:hypothetical protein AB205_0044100 [Pelobates cultripes]